MQNKAMKPPLMFINKNSIDYKYNFLGDLKPRVKAHYPRGGLFKAKKNFFGGILGGNFPLIHLVF